jgi:cytochrome c peroxidase
MQKIIFSLFIVGSIIAISCNKSVTNKQANQVPTLPNTVDDYENILLPNGMNINAMSGNNNTILPFIDFNNQFQSGQNVKVTNHGATLGRVLFYDKKLSLNNTVACGSCHLQSKAFSDGEALSKGFEGRITSRNSMAISNPQLANNLFWDSRSSTIQDLSLLPVQNHIEMGMENLATLEKKLQSTSYYPQLFQNAFGTSTITKELISDAMSQFVASLVTKNSKFDEAQQNGFSTFTQLELHGMNLFNGSALCSSCHAGASMSAPDAPGGAYGSSSNNGGGSGSNANPKGTTNIGLDLVPTDLGKENGNFKIPSLRNIALTAPYMHDGRFKTLSDVLNHYTSGIKPTQNLDVKFRNLNGSVKHIQMSEADKIAIVAFLNTLTDYTYTTDKKYSNPF